MNWLPLYVFLFSQESDKRQNFQHFRSTMNSLEWLFSFHVFLTCNGKVLAEIFVSFEYFLGAIASAFKLWPFARWEQAMMRTLSFHRSGMGLILRHVIVTVRVKFVNLLLCSEFFFLLIDVLDEHMKVVYLKCRLKQWRVHW